MPYAAPVAWREPCLKLAGCVVSVAVIPGVKAFGLLLTYPAWHLGPPE